MTRHSDRLPKLCGADIELGNFILGSDQPGGSGRAAARALLHEIAAPYARPEAPFATATAYDPQDWGREFLSTNGGCFYIDLDHLECCIPEVLSAWDHVAAWHATLRIAGRALADANAKLPPEHTIQLLANNSDGRGNAYGSHLSFLVTRRTWDNIFERKMHHLLVLASFLASSVVVTGAGKVGAENGRPDVAFQLSQRADFFETLVGTQTTYRRPIVNSRDEPLCGSASTMARLHCIFFDNTLCHGSSLLKVGTTQLVLGLLESERANPDLILDDPVAALRLWSHDPTLTARARMASGRMLTAIELQLLLLEEARRLADARGYDGMVPRAAEILAFWEDTVLRLRSGDIAGLASRLDWALKLHILGRAMASRPDLCWSDPALKHLDHLYASLDTASGLYWAYEQVGAVERLVSEADIARLVHDPPEDTRAWGRAMLLRLGSRQVHDVDWDRVRFRQRGPGYWPALRTVSLDDPLGFTRAAMAPVIEGADTLDDVLDALGATPPAYEVTPLLAPAVPPESPSNGGSHPRRRYDHDYT